MPNEVIIPLKGQYSLKEFWDEFSDGSLWKQYAKANPLESSNIAEIVQLKIEQKPYGQPSKGQPVLKPANTHTGKALVMILCTLH